jgi:hypothetical protein
MRTLLVWLSLCAMASAVDLPLNCRVANIEGRCFWANAATIGYRHRIPALQALAPRRIVQPWGYATDDGILRRLDAAEVRWRWHKLGSHYRGLLPEANRRGVIVSMKAGTHWFDDKYLWTLHSIILTKYDPAANVVEFYCPNSPAYTFKKSVDWFESGWAGDSIVID